MDVIQVAQQIEQKIQLLERGRGELESLAQSKARTIAGYDKELSITILRLRDAGSLPATLIEKVARGQCHKERLSMELADALYKVQTVKMNAVQAELNGWQSINKFLDNK